MNDYELNMNIMKAKMLDMLMDKFKLIIEPTFENSRYTIISLTDSDIYDKISECFEHSEGKFIKEVMKFYE